MSKYFDQLLNVFWLRPETSLWRSIDIDVMKNFEFSSPSLDLGTGDGIFSFIRAGGQFDIAFDAFQSVSHLDHFFDNVDVFDSFDKPIKPIISRPSDYQIDFGFDHKDNLIKKAKTLDLYKSLILGDANQPLPFNNNFFRSVFSNIIYWLDDPQKIFCEISRILKPGGRCCVMLPNKTFPEFSFYYNFCVKTENHKFDFLEKLDRGRMSENIKHAKSGKEWKHIFERAGLDVVSHKTHLSKTVIQIWDIGLRPLFPLLHKMVRTINEESLVELKREWIKTMKIFLDPIRLMDNELNTGIEAAFHCFILEKNRGR